MIGMRKTAVRWLCCLVAALVWMPVASAQDGKGSIFSVGGLLFGLHVRTADSDAVSSAGLKKQVDVPAEEGAGGLDAKDEDASKKSEN